MADCTQKVNNPDLATIEDDEAEFLPDDYQSDDENSQSSITKKGASNALSMGTQALIDKLGGSLKTSNDQHEEEAEDELKVIFCSRTHSQLSQFVSELRRVKMPPGLPPDLDGHDDDHASEADPLSEDFKHLVLGSRRNLCINPKVKKLENATAINERCLELQQPSTPRDAKCKFIPNPDRKFLVHDFRDHTLAKVRDIEDLGQLGGKLSICPYYASRAAINPSEIVTLPYPLILQKSAREALGLSLKGHIVIVDEAHNLMDTISEIHSVSLSLSQLKRARSQLVGYLQKFRNRLKGKNRVYVTQLVRVVDSLAAYLDGQRRQTHATEGVVNIGDLMAGKGVDQINLYKLMHYLQDSKLARKVEGYADFAGLQAAPNSERVKPKRSSVPVLMQVQSFMLALTYPSAEGRFFYAKPSPSTEHDVVLRYLLLDPTHYFKEIVEEARAVILAGGTMSPIEDYTTHLLHHVAPDRVMTLSCGHIIPRSSLVALPFDRGPEGVDLEFTYEQRKSSAMIQDLGRTILATSKVVPDGLVVFFPSYAYLNTAVKTWQAATNNESLWTKLSLQKRIFFEKIEPAHSSDSPVQSTSTEAKHQKVDQILAEYSAHLRDPVNKRGALLFAVVGGSLSEGINFADKLGRGVIVVGLPFPNAQSPEWKAKMEFVEKRARHPLGRVNAARDFYTNTCMRAVNQSIGRAIRHKDDFAAIMLLDKRYKSEGIKEKLPGWIKESLVSDTGSFDASTGRLRTFFEEKSKA